MKDFILFSAGIAILGLLSGFLGLLILTPFILAIVAGGWALKVLGVL